MSNTNNSGCLFAFLNPLLGGKIESKGTYAETWPYQSRGNLLTASAIKLYKALDDYLDSARFVICPKVSYQDILKVSDGDRSRRNNFQNKISKKRVDFTICDKSNMEIIACVDISSKTGSSEETLEKEKDADKTFSDARIKLLRFPSKTSYSKEEIESKFLAEGLYLFTSSNAGESDSKHEIRESVEGVKSCPKCGSEMVKRIAKSGKNKGNEFYGCSKYPACKEILSV
jgi:hypothetical protein